MVRLCICAIALTLALLCFPSETAAQFGPVDTFTDLSGTTAGTTLTGAILNTGTHGDVTGGWAVTGNGVKAAAHVTNCGLLGTVQVDGHVYPTNNVSLAMSIDNTQTIQIATLSAPSVGILQLAAVTCFTPNIGTFGGSGVWDVVRINQNDGTNEVIQYSQGNCGGTAGFDLEVVVPASSASTCVSAPTGASYWILLLADNRSGTSQMYVLDNTGVLLGSKSMTQATSSDISGVIFGQDQSGTSTGVNTFENMVTRWTGVVPFPLGPVSTTQDPVYWIAKSLVQAAGAGTSLVTTKAVDVPAGATILVATFSENASMTVTAPTDTGSTNTFTHCVACDVTLAANGRGEVWYVTSAVAKTGDLFTCNTNSSTFRNCAAVVLSAGAFDTGAVGTSSAADVTTGAFTPTLNATCTMFGYITAGVALTPGPNYQLGNTSAATSFAFQMRDNAPASSQTGTLKQASTSTKWASDICIKAASGGGGGGGHLFGLVSVGK